MRCFNPAGSKETCKGRKKAEEASLIALEKELATLSENDLAQEIKKGELLMKELIAKNV